MTHATELERFDQAVALLRRDFPSLTVAVERDHPHVDALAELPVQPGLDFPVDFNLQNGDELHLNVARFWVGWFPCGQAEVFDAFVEALTGILSGRYRVLESTVFGLAANARLQRPMEDGDWETLATSSHSFAFLIPWPRKERVVRNGSRT